MILKDVMHTPEIRKNLVSCYLLNKAVVQTLGADLFTLTKNGMFMGKGIPKSKSKTSPYELMKIKPPSLSYFGSWGCLAYVRIPDPKRIKLASRAYECLFIRYALNSKAYRFVDLKSHVILESNDADFHEHEYPFKSTIWGASSSNLPLIRVNENHDDLDSEPRRSKRARITINFAHKFCAYTLGEDLSNLQEALTSKMLICCKKCWIENSDSAKSNIPKSKSDLRKCLCEYVSFLIISAYEFYLDVVSFNAFSDEVVFRINVLASSVKDWILH
uniref:Retrovirus-related Pol polyprotein from transposon TNT 1-94 n=1 Tax=Tanacetum cinerariifolium TaxID=118510 RepID=A0A699KFV4_TANCI|nr:retrovirus-related Pol polyprotein from transposon TNT 1-94 [Tanacetum cinerariifolium]